MNTWLTPDVITREALGMLSKDGGVTWSPFRPTLTINRLDAPVRQVMNAAPLPIDGKALLVLGAAAVIANPQPVSRRSMLGLGWWRRHAR